MSHEYTQPTTNTGTEDRVRWIPSEIETLAQAWVDLRQHDAFASTMELYKAALVSLPAERHRNLSSLDNFMPLKVKIKELWIARAESMSDAPQIVHVETQSAPDYVDIMNRLDTPSLVAMVVSRLGQTLEAFAPAAGIVAKESQPGTPLNPPRSLLVAASAKPRRTRVLLAGPLLPQFLEIESRVKELGLPLDLQFLDKDKKSNVPVSTDFIVATRFISHSFEAAIKNEVPAGKYFYLGKESGIVAVVNKLRELASLRPPRE